MSSFSPILLTVADLKEQETKVSLMGLLSFDESIPPPAELLDQESTCFKESIDKLSDLLQYTTVKFEELLHNNSCYAVGKKW